jgi:hypothetical protein
MYNLCDDLRFIGITSGCPGAFAEKLSLTREVLTNSVVTHGRRAKQMRTDSSRQLTGWALIEFTRGAPNPES